MTLPELWRNNWSDQNEKKVNLWNPLNPCFFFSLFFTKSNTAKASLTRYLGTRHVFVIESFRILEWQRSRLISYVLMISHASCWGNACHTATTAQAVSTSCLLSNASVCVQTNVGRFGLKIISRWTFWPQIVINHFSQIRKEYCLPLSHIVSNAILQMCGVHT